MKIKSNPLNPRILASNNKTVRHEGQVYRIVSNTLGETILAEAHPFTKGEPVNLFAGNKKAKAIRKLVEMGLVS